MPGQIINQTGAAAAYNRFTPFTDPDTGERVWLCGTWVSLQNNTTPPNNGAFYLIRHRDGSYHHGYINDPLHPIPAGQQLTGCRDIEPSPFPEDAGRVLYFCGYDGGIGPSHNTAWIYRSTIPPAPWMRMSITPLGGINYRLDLDASPAAHYQFEQSDDLLNWTPAFYVRNPTDTVKAQMFADLGLGDWIFECRHTTGQQLWEKLKPLHEDRTAARTRVQRAMTQAAAIQKRMVEVLSEAVAKGRSK